MIPSLVFLLCLLVFWVSFNWRLIGPKLGFSTSACGWSRVSGRDRDGQRAWFCPACGREVLRDDRKRPPDCGARIGKRNG